MGFACLQRIKYLMELNACKSFISLIGIKVKTCLINSYCLHSYLFDAEYKTLSGFKGFV